MWVGREDYLDPVKGGCRILVRLLILNFNRATRPFLKNDMRLEVY